MPCVQRARSGFNAVKNIIGVQQSFASTVGFDLGQA